MKKWNPWRVESLVTVFACLLVLPTPARAGDRFQYAAKFLCTDSIPGTSAESPSVVPGKYQTVISIHNPQDGTVKYRKKIAVTFPAATEKPGQVSKFITEELRHDEASQVDCTAIRNDFGISFIHGVEGFLVVESPRSFDVHAVYTAAETGVDGQVESIAAQQVPERRIE